MIKARPPVVVVLGHVDHGKTTLLDYLRKTKQTENEAGGITQSIGAYEVEVPTSGYDIGKITFIDTPGHEAFSRLRLSGASVADIAVLIVDAVDSVMPQTIESISHIKNAKIPFIVAINKIDLERANVDKVKRDLGKHDVLVEGSGGEVPVVSISAREGTGVNQLLETLLFLAQLSQFKYDTDNPPQAYIIESKKDRSGILVSAVLKDGILKTGTVVYTSTTSTKIKALLDEYGEKLALIEPSTPCQIMGFDDLPEPGTLLTTLEQVLESEKLEEPKKTLPLTAIDFLRDEDDRKKLKVIIKTDTQGSLDAIVQTLSKNENVEIVLASIGTISKSDVFLAKVTKAIVVGFVLTPDKNVIDIAKQEKVVMKTYSIIYEMFDELNEVSRLIEEREREEKQPKSEAKILANFIIEKERIAGVKVTTGRINLGDEIEIFRGEKLIGKAKIASLKTRARNMDEVKKGSEAGIIFYPQLDFNIGDVVKSYSI